MAKPTDNSEQFLDQLISQIQQHLTTVGGMYITTATYPPSPLPLPGIANWTGYTIPPAQSSGEVPSQFDEIEVDEENKEEAIAIKRDIAIEYPKTQKTFEQQFSSKAAAFAHNKNVKPEEVIQRQKEFNDNPEPSPNIKVGAGVNKKDAILFEKCGNGLWPATGEAPNFDVQSVQGTRTWYKQNSAYIKQNCAQIKFPTASGDKTITVHKDLAAIVEPALKEIRAKGLQKYIENCAGGLAVRNVTGGTRLSNHSWGTAIDMNTIKYPYGVSFKSDGIYVGSTKKRNLNEFDKGFQQVAAIFKSKGMTWLSNNDPMHVSIYE